MNESSESLLGQEQHIAQNVSNWADLSNALYDPLDGLLAKAYPTQEARLTFIRTAEYRAIQLLLANDRGPGSSDAGLTPAVRPVFLHRETGTNGRVLVSFHNERNRGAGSRL